MLYKVRVNVGRAESHASSDWCHHTHETHNILLLSGLATCTMACLLRASHLCLPFQGQYLANRICSAMVTSKQSLGPLSHLPVSWVISSAYSIVATSANSAFHRIGAAGGESNFGGALKIVSFGLSLQWQLKLSHTETQERIGELVLKLSIPSASPDQWTITSDVCTLIQWTFSHLYGSEAVPRGELQKESAEPWRNVYTG